MSNYPDGMTRSDLIAVGEIDPPAEPVTRVAMVTVFLTYTDENPDDYIMLATTIRDISEDIKRVLGGDRRPDHLKFVPNEIEIGDYEWLTPANAPDYGFSVSPD